MDLSTTLVKIATILEENDFRYALIGGLALAAYGHPRSTLDIDFAVEFEHQDRIIGFMESQGYETLHRSRGYSNHRHVDPQLGNVDFVYLGANTAAKLFSSVTHFNGPGEMPVPVPKPEHLIAMKVLAIKNDPSRVFQEMADIRVLMAKPGVDLEAVRGYFEQHGLVERFNELQRLL